MYFGRQHLKTPSSEEEWVQKKREDKANHNREVCCFSNMACFLQSGEVLKRYLEHFKEANLFL